MFSAGLSGSQRAFAGAGCFWCERPSPPTRRNFTALHRLLGCWLPNAETRGWITSLTRLAALSACRHQGSSWDSPGLSDATRERYVRPGRVEGAHMQA